MVGYDGQETPHLSEFWHGMAGILSGIATRFLCQPLDVLKIRFQLQYEPLRPNSNNYYWGLNQAVKRIFEEESYRALWKGHVPAQLLSGVYGLVQFGTFEFLTKTTHFYLTDEYKVAVHFICGSMSGAVATVFSLPFDTVRTRLVGQGEPKVYNGVSHAFRTMVKSEGISSIYKGMTPALLQIMPYAGMQFGTFTLLSNLYNRHNGKDDDKTKVSFWNNLLCGAASGLVAKLTVYPLDLVKKRLQIQGFEAARTKFGKVRKCNGTVECLRLVLTEEGFRGLYKGISPSLIKAVATTGLMFAFYEELLRIFKTFNR